jgi:hypothetical protein
MIDDPRSYNTPELKALLPEQIDNLGRAVISLTREICVLTDRLAVTEAWPGRDLCSGELRAPVY